MLNSELNYLAKEYVEHVFKHGHLEVEEALVKGFRRFLDTNSPAQLKAHVEKLKADQPNGPLEIVK